MKLGMRSLAILMVTGCVVSACGSENSTPDGTGGSSGSGGSGSGGSGSGGSGSGGKGSGGSASGGATGSGGSASGSGGSASGGATGSGGSATGSGGSASGSGGSASGGAAGGGAGQGGSSNPTGGAGGRGAQAGRGGGLGGRGQGGGSAGGSSGSGGSSGGGGASGGGGSSGAFSPCPTDGMPCRILPIGDSITVGINYEGAWRVEIFHRAVMAGQKITFTGHDMNGPQTVDMMSFPRRYEAQSGITIDGISKKIDTDMAFSTPTPADIVLMHIGTNDMNMSPAGAPDRLAKLIDKITTALPNALLVVAKIIPLNNSVQAFNDAIPGIVDMRVAQGKHIKVVDLNTGFPMGGMDSVHPYQSGYNWMGDKFYEVIKDLLPK